MEIDSSVANVDASAAPNEEVVGKAPVDPLVGKACHQCRHKITTSGVICKNWRKNKPCTIKLCKSCLWNRYGETVEVVAALENWSCPKCRGICNCSVCMKRKGYRPTGPLTSKAMDKRYSSVSEMLVKEPECLELEKVGEAAVDSPQNEGSADSPIKIGGENSSDGIANESDSKVAPETILPVGKELTIVAGVTLPSKDVGNALQLLEFFFTFGQLLGVRQGLPEQVVHDLFQRIGARGRYSVTVQLHVQLLSELYPYDEEIRAEGPDNENSPWFQKLKSLSETQKMLKLPVLDSLDKANDYEDLDASEKLMILNILCDEVLATKKVRKFITKENKKFIKNVKQARQRKSELLKKAKIVAEERKNVNKEAVILKDGDSVTISKQAKASSDKSVAGHDTVDVAESNDEIFLKGNPTCDATRTAPIFVDPRGHAYWKLNCLGKQEMVAQEIGHGDGTGTFNEKLSSLDVEEKEVVEKHGSSLKKQRRKRKPRKV